MPNLSPEQDSVLQIVAEARRLVDEQRRRFRDADFAGFLATAQALDLLTQKLQKVQAEHLNDVSRASLLDLHDRIEQQRELLVMAVSASIPPMRTYARGPTQTPKSSILLDSYS